MAPDLIYIGISIIACVTTWRLSKGSGIDRLLNLRVPEPIIKWLTLFASVSILFLLVDEIGLFIEEWGYSSGPLGYFRFIEGISGIEYFDYLMYITLSSYALWEILKAQEFRSLEVDSFEIKRINVNVVLAMINLMLLITSVQLLTWDKVSLEAGIVIVIFMSISTLLSGRATTRIQRHLEKKEEPLDGLRRWHAWLLIFAMVFLQTMIIKAGILLILIPYTRQKILRLISILINRPFDIKDSEEVRIEDLSNRISIANRPALWGFYFLCTSSFVMLIFFQMHVSPFPPLMSGFPKTETISLIYTLDILFFCYALLARRFTKLAVLIASAFLITTRYLLPVVAPSLFIPSQTPPGFNTVAGVSELFGPWAVPLWGIIIHLTMFTFFMVQSKLLVNAQAVLINNKVQYLKDLGIATILMELSEVMLFLVLGGGLFGLSFLWCQAPVEVVFIWLVLVGILSTSEHLPRYRKRTTTADSLFSDIEERQSTEGIDKMLSACPLLAHFGLWRQGRGRDWFLIIIWLNAVLFFGGAVLILFIGLI